MRYSIMLQLVTATTLILVATAALFAWLQNRTPSVTQEVSQVYRQFDRNKFQ